MTNEKYTKLLTRQRTRSKTSNLSWINTFATSHLQTPRAATNRKFISPNTRRGRSYKADQKSQTSGCRALAQYRIYRTIQVYIYACIRNDRATTAALEHKSERENSSILPAKESQKRVARICGIRRTYLHAFRIPLSLYTPWDRTHTGPSGWRIHAQSSLLYVFPSLAVSFSVRRERVGFSTSLREPLRNMGNSGGSFRCAYSLFASVCGGFGSLLNNRPLPNGE